MTVRRSSLYLFTFSLLLSLLYLWLSPSLEARDDDLKPAQTVFEKAEGGRDEAGIRPLGRPSPLSPLNSAKTQTGDVREEREKAETESDNSAAETVLSIGGKREILERLQPLSLNPHHQPSDVRLQRLQKAKNVLVSLSGQGVSKNSRRGRQRERGEREEGKRPIMHACIRSSSPLLSFLLAFSSTQSSPQHRSRVFLMTFLPLCNFSLRRPLTYWPELLFLSALPLHLALEL